MLEQVLGDRRAQRMVADAGQEQHLMRTSGGEQRAGQAQSAGGDQLRCRAYVAFASFADPTGGGYQETAGSSAIWSPAGNVLAQAGMMPGHVARATLE